MVACLFLPDTVAGIQDTQTIGKLDVKDSSSMSVETNPEMTLTERLNLISISNSMSVPVKNGKMFNNDTAIDRAVSELKRFSGDEGFGFDFTDVTIDLLETLLIIDSDDPSINMLAWRLILSDNSRGTITLVIDDATGTIIQLIFKLNISTLVGSDKDTSLSSEFYQSVTNLCHLMTDYYDTAVRLAEYELLGSRGYYKAEIWDGGAATPMFGIVQSNSFSINDKHSPN